MTQAETTVAAGQFGPDIFCPACAYQLHHAPGERCPECGYALGRLRSGESPIPWVRRKELGRLRAFWQTVWQVQFRHREFCEAYAGRVSLADARAFQRAVVTWVMLPLLAWVVLIYVVSPPEVEALPAGLSTSMLSAVPSGIEILAWAFGAVWPLAILLGLVVVWLFAVTGCPSYFFHPKPVAMRQQNNAVAMSYYASGALVPAALAGFGVVALAMAQLVLKDTVATPWDWAIVFVCSTAIAVVFSGVWWGNLIRILRRMMPLRPRRAWALAVGLPVMWVMLTGLILVALPAVLMFVWVVFASLRTYPPAG
jgi:hypothetical protein